MILVKVHKTEDRIILCLCDKDLIGKKFEDKEFILDVSERFYNGKEIDKDIKKMIENANIINVVGKESIKFLIDNKIINKDGIKKIAGVPHAQVLYS